MFKRIKSYIVESYHELKKVNWPSQSETVRLTIIVISMSIFVAVFLGIIDMFTTHIIEQLIM